MNRTEIVIQAMVMSSWFATENPQHRSLHNDLDEADFDLDADTSEHKQSQMSSHSFHLTALGRPKSFIADFGRAADCCYNPDLMDYVVAPRF